MSDAPTPTELNQLAAQIRRNNKQIMGLAFYVGVSRFHELHEKEGLPPKAALAAIFDPKSEFYPLWGNELGSVVSRMFATVKTPTDETLRESYLRPFLAGWISAAVAFSGEIPGGLGPALDGLPLADAVTAMRRYSEPPRASD